ncbi:MAG: hypothetical protein DRI73_11535 [Bacteroidetes bacterium]|nr:MAG: hypothetical protein DRI73_11535 [Bacteroidota bacterium]
MQFASSSILEPYLDNIQNLNSNPEMAMVIIKQAFILLLITVIAYTFLYTFLSYILLNPAALTINKHISLLGDVIRKYYLPILVATMIATVLLILGATIGVFFLIIGSFIAALYLGSVFFIIIPLSIIENTGSSMTISRCFKLVHTNLWRTVGWVFVFFALFLIASMLISIITLIPFTGDFFEMIKNPAASLETSGGNILNNPLQFLLSSAGNALLLPFMPIFSTLIYFSLKYNEDPGIENNEGINILEHFR